MDSENSIYSKPQYVISNDHSLKSANTQNYIKDQLNIITNNNKKLVPINSPNITDLHDISNPQNIIDAIIPNIIKKDSKLYETTSESRYDPYISYLHDNGLYSKQNVISRYEVNYLNIDSSQRNKIPSLVLSQTSYELQQNPFFFTKESNILTIRQLNNTFNVNDRISILGVIPKTVQISTTGIIRQDVETITNVLDQNQNIVNIIGNTTTNLVDNSNIFEFDIGSQYMKFNYSHNLPVINNFVKLPGNTGIFINDPYLDSLDTTNLIIEISGFRGNSITSADGGSYFDNIPVSFINGKHSIILQNPVSGRIVRNVFYILLPTKYSSTSGQFIVPSPKYNFKLIYYYLAGVPINYINSNYPINQSQLQGYHIISKVTKDTFSIQLGQLSTGALDPVTFATYDSYVGGNNIEVVLVTDVNKGYTSPNTYAVELEKVYTNIISIRMISSEFPNSQKIITTNNKLYWQNQDDGAYVYSISLNSGNYTPESITNIIEDLTYKTSRINYTTDNPTNTTNFVQTISPYTNHNILKVNIDTVTDLVTFSSFKEIIIFRPIVSVKPEIQINLGSDPTSDVNYIITINHVLHNLNIGDTITISNAIDHLGIPASILNGVQTVNNIVDENNYDIQLSKFNLEPIRSNTRGGVAVSILTANKFRLRFDYPDTFGSILGFRNVGNSESITNYSNIISNNDLYNLEPSIDETGSITVKNNPLNFAGDNYILLVCQQINTLNNTGQNKNVFAKILLSDSPGKILFNTFVSASKIYNNPLPQLSRFDFEFYSPDGTLFDFNNFDHSFTLEIISINDIPRETNISSRTGK